MDDKKSREQGKYHISPENQVMFKSCDSHFCRIKLFWSNVKSYWQKYNDVFAVQKVGKLLPPSLEIYDQICILPSATWNTKWGAFSLQKHGQSLNVLLLHSSWAAPTFFHKSFIFSAMGQILSQQKWCLTQTKNLFLFPRDV